MKSFHFYYDDIFFDTNIKRVGKEMPKNSTALIQVFAHRNCRSHISGLCGKLKTVFKDALIIGSTSDGEFIGSNVTIDQTVVAITVFENSHLELVSENFETGDDYYELGKNLVAASHPRAKVFICFATAVNFNAEEFLSGIDSVLDCETVSGGIAAGESPLVFDHASIYAEGAVGVLIYNKDLRVQTFSKSGWVPVGKGMKITKAEKNRVYTIDNKPAIEMYKYYLGEGVTHLLHRIGIEFPLINKKTKKARALLNINGDGSIYFGGNFAPGDRVFFGYGSQELFLENHSSPPPHMVQNCFETIFVYSCIARRKLMPDSVYREIEPYTQLAPVGGFFTHGEFFTKNKKHLFLNQTMSVLAMSEAPCESSNIPLKGRYYDTIDNIDYYHTQKALMHLIKRDSQEIEELNKNLEKRVKEKLRELREKDALLLQQSKLASLGEMIGNIAHQWRQPLNVIGALHMWIEAKMYEKGFLDKTDYKDINETVNEQLEYMSNTIDDFRGLVKNGEITKRFNLTKAVQNVIKLLQSDFKRYGITILLQGDDIYCVGNSSNFKHVVINILNNAKDAICSHSEHKQNYILISVGGRDDQVHMEIQDTGGGIDEAIKEKIFDPYFSTKFRNKGTGIGLYMSYKIINTQFNGSISAKNTRFDHRGTTFKGANFKITITS